MELNDDYFCTMCSNMRNIVKTEEGDIGFHCKSCNSTEPILCLQCINKEA